MLNAFGISVRQTGSPSAFSGLQERETENSAHSGIMQTYGFSTQGGLYMGRHLLKVITIFVGFFIFVGCCYWIVSHFETAKTISKGLWDSIAQSSVAILPSAISVFVGWLLGYHQRINRGYSDAFLKIFNGTYRLYHLDPLNKKVVEKSIEFNKTWSGTIRVTIRDERIRYDGKLTIKSDFEVIYLDFCGRNDQEHLFVVFYEPHNMKSLDGMHGVLCGIDNSSGRRPTGWRVYISEKSMRLKQITAAAIEKELDDPAFIVV